MVARDLRRAGAVRLAGGDVHRHAARGRDHDARVHAALPAPAGATRAVSRCVLGRIARGARLRGRQDGVPFLRRDLADLRSDLRRARSGAALSLLDLRFVVRGLGRCRGRGHAGRRRPARARLAFALNSRDRGESYRSGEPAAASRPAIPLRIGRGHATLRAVSFHRAKAPCGPSFKRPAGRSGRSSSASVIALALIFERLWSLRTSVVAPPGLVDRVLAEYRHGGVTPELLSKTAQQGPLGRILAAGLANIKSPRPVMQEAIEEAGRVVTHDLERFLTTLGTIAAMAPLLGLFGTVIGMIEIFGSQNRDRVEPAAARARHLGRALQHRARPHRRDPQHDLLPPLPRDDRRLARRDGAAGDQARRLRARRAQVTSGAPQ